MANLPASLRAQLTRDFSLHSLRFDSATGSKDTTRKFLFQLNDNRFVESVLIPANPALYSEGSARRTICVSSQVGCAYGCKFCASGLDGFTRNLTADEIIDQLLLVERHSGEKINNVVFMGMGEPLANLNNLLAAIEKITAPYGLNIGARHLTVSTSGLVTQIKKLAQHPQQIRLAISLHGATNEVRSQIMPINRKYPLELLIPALEFWNQHKKQRLTFEYILIQGVNDSLQQAQTLAKIAKPLNAKVNLIPYNSVDGLNWKRPPASHCHAFRRILQNHQVTATLRIEKGHDIDAACGQLRLKRETPSGEAKPC
jgi:23S rRNA (adenine2503-C2)-methyltransferase